MGYKVNRTMVLFLFGNPKRYLTIQTRSLAETSRTLLLLFSKNNTLQMLSTSLTRLTLGSASIVPRLTPVLLSAQIPKPHLKLAPTVTPICALHTSDVVERARQSTRIRKKKINDANKKKKEERLRKNPPPIPKKVILKLTNAFFYSVFS